MKHWNEVTMKCQVKPQVSGTTAWKFWVYHGILDLEKKDNNQSMLPPKTFTSRAFLGELHLMTERQ